MFCGNLPPNIQDMSSKDKDSASHDGEDGAGKMKHRRGMYIVYIIIL